MFDEQDEPSHSFFAFDMNSDDSGFTGYGKRQHHRARRKKGDNVMVEIKVTLEELYKGSRRTIQLERTGKCKECDGSGLKAKARRKTCLTCSGKGYTMKTEHSRHFMREVRMECPVCHGSGTMTREKDRCKSCHGKRIQQLKLKIQVDIKPGMSHGDQITFHGLADITTEEVEWNVEPGDIIVVLKQVPHERFRRIKDTQGSWNDLWTGWTVSLTDAISPAENQTLIITQHLDGRFLTLKRNPGEILRPGDVKMIRGEGMPAVKAGSKRGDLYVKIAVQFPPDGWKPTPSAPFRNFMMNDNETKAVHDLFKSILPPSPPSIMPNDPSELNRTHVQLLPTHYNDQDCDDLQNEQKQWPKFQKLSSQDEPNTYRRPKTQSSRRQPSHGCSQQ